MLGIIGGAAVVMAPLVGFDFIPDIITNRVTSIFEGDTSSDYRFQAWQSAAALIKDYWISGIGMDSQTFLRVYPDYMMSDVRVFHFHNVFLQFFAEGGILLLSSFLFLFYWTARTLVSVMFRSKSRGRGWDSLLAKALFASLFAIALSGMTEDIFRHYRLDLTFFIILGIAAAVTARTESEGTGHEG